MIGPSHVYRFFLFDIVLINGNLLCTGKYGSVVLGIRIHSCERNRKKTFRKERYLCIISNYVFYTELQKYCDIKKYRQVTSQSDKHNISNNYWQATWNDTGKHVMLFRYPIHSRYDSSWSSLHWMTKNLSFNSSVNYLLCNINTLSVAVYSAPS